MNVSFNNAWPWNFWIGHFFKDLFIYLIKKAKFICKIITLMSFGTKPTDKQTKYLENHWFNESAEKEIRIIS